MSQPCPHLLPLVMALDGATRTPEEPLAIHSSSHLLAKPAQGLLPKQESRDKAWLKLCAMNGD